MSRASSNRLEDELTDLSSRRVDLASKRSLHPLRRDGVLGEAAGQVSTALTSRSPELPWADASRTRNRILHGYWSVDFEALAAIASDDLQLRRRWRHRAPLAATEHGREQAGRRRERDVGWCAVKT